jgi:hypothetical protein
MKSVVYPFTSGAGGKFAQFLPNNGFACVARCWGPLLRLVELPWHHMALADPEPGPVSLVHSCHQRDDAFEPQARTGSFRA